MEHKPLQTVQQTQGSARRPRPAPGRVADWARNHVRLFNRYCAGFAVLCCMLFAAILPAFDSDPFFDFPQYYLGGLAARYGAMDHVYPISTSQTINPGWPKGSVLTPEMEHLAQAHGCPSDSFRYIQAPPNAYLYAPLTLFNFHLSKRIWGALMMLCVAYVAISAGQLIEALIGRQTPLSGLIIVVIALTPRVYIVCESTNVSQLVAAFCGVIAVELVRGKDRLGPLAMAVGAITKFFTLPLAAVYVLQKRWLAIAFMLALSAIICGLTIMASGLGPWRQYLALSHSFDRVAGTHSMVYVVEALTRSRLPRSTTITIIRAVFGIVILLGTWLYASRRAEVDRLATAAYIAVLFTASLLASPLFWGHYLLFIFPLWGWLMWELVNAPKRRVPIIIAWILLSFPLGPVSRILATTPLLSYQIWGTLLILILALARLVDSMRSSRPSDVQTAAPALGMSI